MDGLSLTQGAKNTLTEEESIKLNSYVKLHYQTVFEHAIGASYKTTCLEPIFVLFNQPSVPVIDDRADVIENIDGWTGKDFIHDIVKLLVSKCAQNPKIHLIFIPLFLRRIVFGVGHAVHLIYNKKMNTFIYIDSNNAPVEEFREQHDKYTTKAISDYAEQHNMSLDDPDIKMLSKIHRQMKLTNTEYFRLFVEGTLSSKGMYNLLDRVAHDNKSNGIPDFVKRLKRFKFVVPEQTCPQFQTNDRNCLYWSVMLPALMVQNNHTTIDETLVAFNEKFKTIPEKIAYIEGMKKKLYERYIGVRSGAGKRKTRKVRRQKNTSSI